MAPNTYTDLDIVSAVAHLGVLPPSPHLQGTFGAFSLPSAAMDEDEMHARLSWIGLSADDGGMYARAQSNLPMRNFANITQFTSMHELLSVLIDAVRMHEVIVAKDLFRSEVSIGNIVISTTLPESARPHAPWVVSQKKKSKYLRLPESRAAFSTLDMRRGYLINFTRDGEKIVQKDPQAVVPFISIDELLTPAGAFQREPHHDLESFFYILLWICTHYDSPEGMQRKDRDLSDTVLHCWSYGESPFWCGTVKKEAMHNAEIFEQDILNVCSPYFEDLKPCLRRLRVELFGRKEHEWRKQTTITHKEMIRILQQTFDTLARV